MMIMMMVDIIATVIVMIVIILMTIITTTGVDIDEGTIAAIDHAVCHPIMTTVIMRTVGEGRRNSKLNMAIAQIIIGTIEDCRDHTTEKIVITTNMKVVMHVDQRGIGVVEVVIDDGDDNDTDHTAIGEHRTGRKRVRMVLRIW